MSRAKNNQRTKGLFSIKGIKNIVVAFGFSLMCTFSASGQELIFPVNVEETVSHPFSPYLTDYTSGSDNFIVRLSLADWYQQPSVTILLKLEVRNIGGTDVRLSETDKVITLEQDLPITLTGNDLQIADLFDDDVKLPEGLYVFKLIAYDVTTGLQLSEGTNVGEQQVFILDNQPPLLNLPADGLTLDKNVYPLNSPIVFNWTPRHVSFDPTGGSYNYVLELFGYFDGQENLPPNAIATSANLLDQWEITNGGTQLVLSSDEWTSALGVSHNRFAWRVSAVSSGVATSFESNGFVPGAQSKNYFENNGTSEVFSFYLTEPCDPPRLLEIAADNPQEIEVSVIRDIPHVSYDFMYRVYGNDEVFRMVNTENSELTISDLEPNTTYEIDVVARCGEAVAVQKNLGNITTLDQEVDVCEVPTFANMEKAVVGDETLVTLSWDPVQEDYEYHIEVFIGDPEASLGTYDITETSHVVDVTGYDLSQPMVLKLKFTEECEGGPIEATYAFDISQDSDYEGACAVPSPMALQVIPSGGTQNPQYTISWPTNESYTSFSFDYEERYPESDAPGPLSVLVTAPDHSSLFIPYKPSGNNDQPELGELKFGTDYNYTVTFTCLDGETAVSDMAYFNIPDPDAFTDVVDEGTGSCFPPAGTLAEVESPTEATVYWDKANHNVGYQFMYRVKDASNWEIINQFEKSIELAELVPETIYEYQVRTECEDGWSLFTAKKAFTTDKVTTSRSTEVPCEEIEEISLSNPGAGLTSLNLQFLEKEGYLTYSVEYKDEHQGVNNWYNLTAYQTVVDPETDEESEALVTNFTIDHTDQDDNAYFSALNLLQNTSYDFRVTGHCASGKKAKSKVFSFSTTAFTPPLTEFSCGDTDIPCDFGTETPAGEELAVKKKFWLGGFELEVVSGPKGSYDDVTDGTFDGTPEGGYSGFAHAVIPYMNMAQIEVHFEGVKVATTTVEDDSRLCAFKGDGDVKGTIIRVIPEEWSDKINAAFDELDGYMAQVQTYTDLSVDMLNNLDEIINSITDPVDMSVYDDWTPEELLYEGIRLYNEFQPLMKQVLNGDVSGLNVLEITQNMKLAAALIKKAYELGAELLSDIKGLDATDNQIVHFSAFSNDPGFDKYDGEHLATLYEQLETSDEPSKQYFVPYVAIDPAFDHHSVGTGIKKVIATVTMPTGFDQAKLSFVSNSSVGLEAGLADKTLDFIAHGSETHQFEVSVLGTENRVFAIYEDDEGKKLKLGKLKIVSTPEIEKTVVIVPNQSGHGLVASQIETELNSIYEAPNVTFHVEIAPSWNQPELWDNSDPGIQIDDYLSKKRVTDEMKLLQEEYFSTAAKDHSKSYLFLVDGLNNIDGDLENLHGYMPRGKDVGYIHKNHVDGKTIAHELGHGLFKLRHIWDLSPFDEEGATTNLMDENESAAATKLAGVQWDKIQNPGLEFAFLDAVEDGALGTPYVLDEFLALIKDNNSNANYLMTVAPNDYSFKKFSNFRFAYEGHSFVYKIYPYFLSQSNKTVDLATPFYGVSNFNDYVELRFKNPNASEVRLKFSGTYLQMRNLALKLGYSVQTLDDLYNNRLFHEAIRVLKENHSDSRDQVLALLPLFSEDLQQRFVEYVNTSNEKEYIDLYKENIPLLLQNRAIFLWKEEYRNQILGSPYFNNEKDVAVYGEIDFANEWGEDFSEELDVMQWLVTYDQYKNHSANYSNAEREALYESLSTGGYVLAESYFPDQKEKFLDLFEEKAVVVSRLKIQRSLLTMKELGPYLLRGPGSDVVVDVRDNPSYATEHEGIVKFYNWKRHNVNSINEVEASFEEDLNGHVFSFRRNVSVKFPFMAHDNINVKSMHWDYVMKESELTQLGPDAGWDQAFQEFGFDLVHSTPGEGDISDFNEEIKGVYYDVLKSTTQARENLEDDPEVIWKLENTVSETKDFFEIGHGSYLETLINERIEEIEDKETAIKVITTSVAIVSAVVSLGTTSPLLAGAAVAVGSIASVYDAKMLYDEYDLLSSASSISTSKEKSLTAKTGPHGGWVVAGVLGAALDFAAVAKLASNMKAFKLNQQLNGVSDVAQLTDTHLGTLTLGTHSEVKIFTYNYRDLAIKLVPASTESFNKIIKYVGHQASGDFLKALDNNSIRSLVVGNPDAAQAYRMIHDYSPALSLSHSELVSVVDNLDEIKLFKGGYPAWRAANSTSIFNTRLQTLGLSQLDNRIANEMSTSLRQSFYSYFSSASDDVLKSLNDDLSLVDAWDFGKNQFLDGSIITNTTDLENINAAIRNSDNSLSEFKMRAAETELLATRNKNLFSFDQSAVQKLRGLSDEIELLAIQHGITRQRFLELQGMTMDDMTAAGLLMEKNAMINIRSNLEALSPTTVLQKVIPLNEIEKYLDGTYRQVGGFVSTAKDCKQLTNYKDVYSGLRLDYKLGDGVSQNFYLSDGSCGVIRYRVADAGSIEDAVLPGVVAPEPYTGHGFTSAPENLLGGPEWKSPYLDLTEGELWELYSDGTAVLRGKFSSTTGRFMIINK